MSNPIAIYHMNCSDGTMAAAVFLRKYPGSQTFPVSHGASDADIATDIAPALIAAEQASEIFFLDCEIGHAHFVSKGYKVTIIDHHISYFETLSQEEDTQENLTYVFDNTKSGASLAWSYFFPEEELPELVRYIEDADLWRLSYGDTSLSIREYCSKFWNKPEEMLSLLAEPIEQIHAKGKTIHEFIEAAIHNSLRHIASLSLTVGPYIVRAYNITMFQHVVGKRFSKETGEVVILYVIEGDVVRTNIRSHQGQSPTALDIAKLLGGGGHEHIAGAEIPTAQFFNMLEMPE